MKKARPKRILLPLLCLLLYAMAATAGAEEMTFRSTPVKALFSPKGGCTEAIVQEINSARSEILIQAYSFTSTAIAQALLNAHQRGVRVEAILDKSQRKEKYTSATFLANAGIPTYIDDKHAIAHNKIIVVDGEIVITGSFNFTKAAEEKNAENLLIIRSGDLARTYIDNWRRHKRHSVHYVRPDVREGG